MCEWKDVGISHEFEKEDVAALFENWREVGRGVGEREGGCGGCVGLGLLVLYLIVLKPFVLILSCSLTPQFSFSIPFPFDIYFLLYYNQSLWMQTSLPAVILQFLR